MNNKENGFFFFFFCLRAAGFPRSYMLFIINNLGLKKEPELHGWRINPAVGMQMFVCWTQNNTDTEETSSALRLVAFGQLDLAGKLLLWDELCKEREENKRNLNLAESD